MYCPMCEKDNECKIVVEFYKYINCIEPTPMFYYECVCMEQHADRVMLLYNSQHKRVIEEFTRKVNATREHPNE